MSGCAWDGLLKLADSFMGWIAAQVTDSFTKWWDPSAPTRNMHSVRQLSPINEQRQSVFIKAGLPPKQQVHLIPRANLFNLLWNGPVLKI